MGSTSQFLRDMRKRVSARDLEIQRRAYLFVARNTTLSPTIRHKAQLGLNALNGGEGRMGAVKSRCVETGRGRGESGGIQGGWRGVEAYVIGRIAGVMTQFGLCRFQFRTKALAGELPGVQKSTW
ncbi:small subunit ribosomal protein S14, partial [Tremellales sp. Uapishka_1]